MTTRRPDPAALPPGALQTCPGGVSVTREEQLVDAFVEAADTLVDDFDVIEFLHTLAERCVQLLKVDAAGLMLADQRGQLHATAASSENARLLELFELQSDAGPCLDAFRTGAPVVNADLRANQERWPSFAEAAQASGFVSVHALPLRLRATIIGALNLFCSSAGPLSQGDVRTGQALADVATIGILAQRTLHQAELLSVQLQQALGSRVAIEQAKGVLAERRRTTVDEAFDVLRRHARNRDLLLSDLAADVARRSRPSPTCWAARMTLEHPPESWRPPDRRAPRHRRLAIAPALPTIRWCRPPAISRRVQRDCGKSGRPHDSTAINTETWMAVRTFRDSCLLTFHSAHLRRYRLITLDALDPGADRSRRAGCITAGSHAESRSTPPTTHSVLPRPEA